MADKILLCSTNGRFGDAKVRYVILFSVVFLATMIAFAFVGNVLFNPAGDESASKDAAGPQPAAIPAPWSGEALRDDATAVNEPTPVVRFVSTAEDPVAEDQDGERAAGDEDPSAVASPSDLRVQPADDKAEHAASAQQKQAAPASGPPVQRRQNCQPPKRRSHRCRLRR